MSSGVDFLLSNTCQFFSLNRGKEDGKIIAAKKRIGGGEKVCGETRDEEGGEEGY